MTTENVDYIEAIAAIRLALVAASDDRSAVNVIRSIVAEVPDSPPDDTQSVHRFLRAAKRVNGKLTVTPEPQPAPDKTEPAT